MAFGNQRNSATVARGVDRAVIDEGLRAYMLRVYNYMASGVALTGAVAYFSSESEMVLRALYPIGSSGYPEPGVLAYAVMFSPLVFILALSFGINRMRASTAQMVFWGFAAVMGLSIAHIFLVYTGESIARVFFITAGAFGALSLYGYTTKRDLTGWRSFLIMGLFGVIIAMVVNMFLGSPAMDFAISVIGVLVFAGLTAYDTQRIKSMYFEGDSSEIASKKAVMGALSLYLDFINMFLMLLRLFGSRN